MRRSCIFLILTGCTLFSRYERPAIAEDATWRTPLPTKEGVDCSWWKQLNDPILDQFIDEALANNQNLQVLIARVDAFQAQLMIARSKLYPQVALNALAQRQKISDSVTALPPGIQQVFNLFGALFNASYLVDLWGEVRSGVEMAYHQWLSAIEARKVAVLSLVSAVASSYIQMRQYDGQVQIAKETLASRRQSLYLAQIRYQLGLTSEMQVEQAISEIESAQIELDMLQIRQAEAENLLCFLLGKAPADLPRGNALSKAAVPSAIPPFLPSDLLCQRPDIRMVEEELIAANANIGVARAQFFPKINLTNAFGYESTQMNTLVDNTSKIWAFGSDIVQQIFTGFALTGNLEQTLAQKQELLHRYLSTILNAYKEANDALTAHKIYLEQIEAERLRVEAQKQYLILSDLRYKEGETDYLTYLDAERQLFRGLLAYEQAKGNCLLSYIQIYQAFGGEWVSAADAAAIESCP